MIKVYDVDAYNRIIGTALHSDSKKLNKLFLSVYRKHKVKKMLLLILSLNRNIVFLLG